MGEHHLWLFYSFFRYVVDCKQSEHVFSNFLTCYRCSVVAIVTFDWVVSSALQSNEVCVWVRAAALQPSKLFFCSAHTPSCVCAVNLHIYVLLYFALLCSMFEALCWVFSQLCESLLNVNSFAWKLHEKTIISGTHILPWCIKGVYCLPLYLPVDVLFCKLSYFSDKVIPIKTLDEENTVCITSVAILSLFQGYNTNVRSNHFFKNTNLICLNQTNCQTGNEAFLIFNLTQT